MGVTRLRVVSRSRYADSLEIEGIKEALRGAPEKYAAFFKLLILTGARPSELAYARREHLQGSTIMLPDSKSGYPRKIHLSSQALRVLEERPAHRVGGRYFDFTVSAAAYQWRTLREKAQCPDIRMYPDLRRTFATSALSAGVPLEHVAGLLGHTSIKHTQIYAKLIDKSAQRGAETAAAALNL